MIHKGWNGMGDVPVFISRLSIAFQGGARQNISPILTPIEYFRTATHRFTYAYEIWHEAWRGMEGVSPYFSMSPVKFQLTLSPAEKWTILTRIQRFWTITPVSIHRWLQSDAHRFKGHTSGALLFFQVIPQIPMTHGPKIYDFGPNWEFRDSMRWMCLLQLPGRSFMHHWSGSGAACFGKNSRTNTVDVFILGTFFQRLWLCRLILISYVIIKCNWLDSGQSPFIPNGCNWYGCLMLSILVAEQTQDEVRSAMRSQFDHLTQLHCTADIHPSGIILSVVL